MNIDNLREDKYLESEDCIFHYTKLSIALEKIIENKKLKYSSLRNTNDPKEYKEMLFNVAGYGEDNRCTNQDVSDTISHVSKIWKEESRILCFSQNSIKDMEFEIFGYSKSRMWSQYGESHKGVCFCFSKKEIINNLVKVKEDNIVLNEPVIYEQSRMKCRTIERDDIIKFGSEACALKHIVKNYQELFFLKNVDYKDESEYRIVLLSKNANCDFLDISKSLKAIILGDSFPKTYLPIIESFCKLNGIIARKLYWSSWTPVLIPLQEYMSETKEKT